ncbi:MAG: PASTA domain-containing protein [Ruminococcaceae bacterium]|nr:PASTA domain-containing protein [Oscillospiraceae bacterium]
MANSDRRASGRRTNKMILSRTLFLMIVCGVVAFLLLIVQLFSIQILQHDKYEQMAVEQQTRETTVSATRGSIMDRNGNILAQNATAYNIYISPAEIVKYEEDVNLIARELSRILEVSETSVLEKAKDVNSWYKTIKTKVEPDVADEVRELISKHKLLGVRIENDTKRYYPYGSLACHIIGFVGTDGYGLEGIEAKYNEYLEGTDGSIARLAAADGTDILYTNYEDYYDAVDGSDLNLTIDVTVQHIAEKYLEQAIADYDVQDGGCCIVMNVNTGEILAMASYDNYDLNNYLAVSDETQAKIDAMENEEERAEALREAQLAQWRNMAISDTYEPGSVFKIITMAMALEEGTASLGSSYYCPGSMRVLGRTSELNCWKTSGHDTQSLTEAAMHSCNIAFVNIGLGVGAERFYDYIDAFGLFEPTGIDLSGEESSVWWTEDIFYDKNNLSQLAAASFGQTFNITPIQMITAVAAACNGGYLLEPYVVSSITNGDGQSVYSKDRTVVRQVVSEETSKIVSQVLNHVVCDSGGTGKNAYVAGYSIGGKTGTSEKVAQDAAGGAKEYMVSFCGIAPTENPEIAVLVILDNPSNETGIYVSGGVMAAPVVGNIFSEILPYMDIEAEYTEEEAKYIDVTMPKLKGETVADAVIKLEELGLKVTVVGDGTEVTDQLPINNAEVAAGTTVIIYTEGSKETGEVTVPNIHNMTVSEARRELAEVGLYLDTSGASPTNTSVVVSSQSVEAGSTVEYGTVIEATLADNSNLGRY